jgi:hypothetical protein
MTRFAIVLLVLCSTGLEAAAPKKKKPAPKPAPAALTIPSGATRIDENTYVHTDAQGKTWTYRKTPFGLQKSERTAESAPYPLPETARDRQTPFSAEGTAAPPQSTDTAEEVTVTESVDNVTFKRKTPFGNNTWTKKKSELTAEERALLERAKAR